ncbi:MAG: YSC84-related protein, partial [Woeseia sp.]
MKAIASVTLVVFFLTAEALLPAQAGWDPDKDKKQLKKVQETVETFKQKDPDLKAFFDKAFGYAVFPTIAKGAIGIGGAHGKGKVFQKGALIGSASVSQGTVGFQLGGQTYSQIIFFKDKVALERFKTEDLKFSAQASAIAVNAGASTTADYSNGVAV